MNKSILCLIMIFLFGGFLITETNASKNPTEFSCLNDPCVSVVCPPDITIDCIENFVNEATDAIAISTCGAITAQWVSNPLQSGIPNCPFTVYTFTYKAVDDQGNIGCCERKVTIDNAAPSVMVPPGTMVDCYNSANVSASDATVMTSCGEDLNVNLYPAVINGVKDCPGTTYTWTYRVIDLCGREATADRVFTNGENDPPTISAPIDITCQCLGGVNPNPDHASVQTSCTLGYSTEVTFVGTSGTMDCPGTNYTYEYKVTDECGRTATDLQVFTIANGPPVFDNCPENCLTLSCEDNYEIFIDAWLMSVTARSSCGVPLTVTNDYDPDTQGVCFDDGLVPVTFTATDQCGRTSICEGMILVLDTKAPQFDPLPMSSTIACNEPIEFDEVEAIDNYSDVTLTYVDELVSDVCLGGDAIRIWTATDECGNSSTATQIVTVLPDVTAPVFTFIPADYSIDCNGSIDFGNATALDDCSNVTLTYSDLIDGDTCMGGTAVRTWTATDDCGNSTTATQTITILPDTEAPVFNENLVDMTLDCNDTFGFDDDVTAMDNCGMVDLTFVDVIAGDFCDGGIATRTWTATDNCDNSVSIVQTITFIPDTEAPTFAGIPGDLTVECTALSAPIVPMVMDNCDQNPLVTFTETIGDPSCIYEVVRTWTAVDNCGNESIETQTITLIDNTPPVFTDTPVNVTVECDNIPPIANVTGEDECLNGADIQFSMDTIPGTCPNSFKLNRIWTATDSCGNSDTFTQMITVEDNTPPTIICPNDTTFNIIQAGVCVRDYKISLIVLDNCDSNLVVNYQIDFETNMIIDSVGSTADACLDIDFPIGISTVTFEVVDDCGNVATCSTVVEVRDLVPPSFQCNPHTFNLAADSTGFVLPSFFLSNLDDCCLDTLVIDDLRDTDGVMDTLFLGPADLIYSDLNGGIPIRSFAIDCSGNSAFCETKLFLLPGVVPPGFAYITGGIFTAENQSLEAIEIGLNGGMADHTSTTADGHYEFMNLPEGFDYHLQPYHDQDPINGISTWDLILLRKHILEIELLESPYKMIAGDINRSGDITTIDMVELRKLILGIIPDFQTNTSWRFVDANFVFPNAINPFESSFPEFCLINDLTNSGMVDLSFVGVKIGDLNGSAETNFQGGSDTRTLDVVHFETKDQSVEDNENITVPIRAKDLQELLGFQFSLQFDPEKLEFVGLGESVLPSFDLNNFGFTFKQDGVITCSWFADKALAFDPDQVLFELKFNAKTSGQLSELLAIGSAYTKAELYAENGRLTDLDLQFNTATETSIAFELFQNRPNPFKGETIIGFSLTEKMNTVFSVFNAAGKLVWQNKAIYPKGYHEFTLPKDHLEGSGMYFYQLKTEYGTISKRMIIME